MKSDLDAMLQAHNLDAILVTGPGQHNPAMVYLTGGGHLTQADLVKKRGEPAVLFHLPMERDEAARTGLLTRSYNDYPYAAFLKEAGQDPALAYALRYERMLTDLGITGGRLGLYGQVELAGAYPVLRALEQRMPGLEIVGDVGDAVLGQVMLTKDADEIERIRQVGRRTIEVVRQVADYLTTRQVDGEQLVEDDGRPVTVGRVKGLINLWLAERGLENPHGTIFAIGRDGAVPHSSGSPGDVICLGRPIVFDIFPCETGGGYHFDFTRTWCLGYAPDEVQGLHQQVRAVFQTITGALKLDTPFGDYQRMACEMYEDMGHATLRSNPVTEEGYVHGLGHGLGLHIHERPFSSLTSPDADRLLPGSVVTIEPGLYYPERGMGMRLEDTLAMHADGTIEVLAEYPHDLVLPMK